MRVSLYECTLKTPSGRLFFKPTFQNICRVEQALNLSIFTLAQHAFEGTMTLEAALTLLGHCAVDDARTIDALIEEMFPLGLGALMGVVHSLLSHILEGTVNLDEDAV